MIDSIDRRIIRELQKDGRQTNREIAEQVGLSPNATGVRIKRLIDGGVITGIHARLDHAQVGRPLEALIECHLSGYPDMDEVLEFFRQDDRIIEAFHITGKVDYILRVAASSTDDLHDLLQEIGYRRRWMDDIETRLVLERIWAQAEAGVTV
ncbi:MAG: Lrp/AsnC family transcriptional regulator [Actinomycetia bacterium]|nr:Lrp/AsnC family transcriptional regulator [Actinomycetes bacterium]MCP3911567.1 Lrp/AsnC family transcriptional regulator [Actinomycetes bacterium]MCP4083845.1 Lrp/AsnC family transcriptional regulator [Actinomycetes bacterium]